MLSLSPVHAIEGLWEGLYAVWAFWGRIGVDSLLISQKTRKAARPGGCSAWIYKFGLDDSQR
jgi:hypothetical protein